MFGEVVDMLMTSRKKYKGQMFDAIESKDKDAENYFKILGLLKKSGSPPVPAKLLKTVNRKKRKIITARTGLGA